MNRLRFLCILVVWFSNLAFGFPQRQSDSEILPDDFSDQVLAHITYLADMGHRQVGSENDKRAVQYIKDQIEKMDIDVEIQPFDFESFEYTNVIFKVGDRQFDVAGLGYNPHKNKTDYEGTAVLINLNESEIRFPQQAMEGKTIVTNNWRGHFRLLRYQPELIIYMDSPGFEDLKMQDDLNFKLKIVGEYKKYYSANVIGRVGIHHSFAREILITAHFDTYRKNNPGASDNASGVGVLLELARYFKAIESELNCTVKFIAFSGEEIGMIGSRKYLCENAESLQRCELLFNIDDVGGNGSVLVEMAGGISGIPETKCRSQIPVRLQSCAWEGVESKWRILADSDLMKIMAVSNHPQWLEDVANKTVTELGYDIKSTGTQGSDQLAFAQAGIVTSGIGIISEHSHTSQDIPEKINKKSLRVAGDIAARVVLNTVKSLKER